jgi:hypothetical protein
MRHPILLVNVSFVIKVHIPVVSQHLRTVLLP